MKTPNATLQAPLEAAATQARRLEAVAWKRLLGSSNEKNCALTSFLLQHSLKGKSSSLICSTEGMRPLLSESLGL
jgi:hypothetical protein